MQPPYRVLACTSAEAERRLRIALQNHELTMALTLPRALEALATRRFDCIVIGMLFDESRALELAETIAARSPETRPAMVGIRGAKVVRAVSPHVFDVPMLALGARDVIDVGTIPDDAAGNALIGARICACVGSP